MLLENRKEQFVCWIFLQLMWQLRISRAQMLPTADNDTVQHFRFSADAPRIAHYKATPSPEEQSFHVLRDTTSVPVGNTPTELAPLACP